MKRKERDMFVRIAALCCFFLVSFQFCNAQEGWENIEDRAGGTQLNNIQVKEGIYRTFEEFKTNSPSITEEFQLRDKQLFLIDTGITWVQVNENKIWGCFKNGKIYVSKDEGLWRCLNVGRLLHFAMIKIQRYMNPNPMYGVTMQEQQVIKQYFLDTETAEVFGLNNRNFSPYAAEEPDIKTFKSNNKNKVAQTILMLKAYKELNPLIINPNE